MFETQFPEDARFSRLIGDIALMTRMHLSHGEMKSLPERKRNAFLWYLTCEDRKMKQKVVEAELRGR